jgi:hypothetical protein
MLSAAVMRLRGTSLMTPSPSGPSDNESQSDDGVEHQTSEQGADLRNAENAGGN